MNSLLIVVALAAASTTTATATATADPAHGQRLFLQCQACHSIAKGQPHKIGPNLNGTIGAAAASRIGYAYSAALTKAALTWDDATLDRWLVRPTAVVPGTKMVFAGVAKPQDRADLIAYLKRAAR